MWLDSSTGTTIDPQNPAHVAQWADQSGLGNNAKATAYQDMPMLLKANYKGFDVLRFVQNGGGLYGVPDVASLQFGTGAFAIVGVVRGNESQGKGVFVWTKNNQDGLRVTIDGKIAKAVTLSASAQAALPNDGGFVFHVITVRGPSLEIRVDGVPTAGTKSTSNLDWPIWPVHMGAGNTTGELYMLQLIAYKGSVSDAQIAGVEGYLKNKFGL